MRPNHPSTPENLPAWHELILALNQTTTRLPIPQTILTINEILHWLFPLSPHPPSRDEQRDELRARFAKRWSLTAYHTLQGETERLGNQLLLDPSLDPFEGRLPYSHEIAQAFWATIAELEIHPPSTEAVSSEIIAPSPYLRFVRCEGSPSLAFPVISFSPFEPVEWQAILNKLPTIVNTLRALDGATVLWLIGRFVRDVEGHIELHPDLSIVPPSQGTRIKTLRAMIVTSYHEQSLTLRQLSPSSSPHPLLSTVTWHRAMLQLDPIEADYTSLDMERLEETERELARRTLYLDQPTHRTTSPPLQIEIPNIPRPGADLTHTPPSSTSTPPHPLESEPTEEEKLRREAERLRQMGWATYEQNPSLAQRYLLASTILDNSDASVWLALANLTDDPHRKAMFHKEATKLLRKKDRRTDPNAAPHTP